MQEYEVDFQFFPQASTKEDTQTLSMRPILRANGQKFSVPFSWQRRGTISWVRMIWTPKQKITTILKTFYRVKDSPEHLFPYLDVF